VPLIPSEAAVISAGVLAGRGDLDIGFVVCAAAAGAVIGDNSGYALGRFLAPRLIPRIERSARLTRCHAWAERTLRRQGPMLFLFARFVPGGRTAVTVTAGLIRLSWPRFVLAIVPAALVWSSVAATLGYAGAQTVGERLYLLAPLAVAVAAIFLALQRAPAARGT
jgi:membrane-associated protein